MEEKKLTLGSLFDGSGGFPLGGTLAGIRPIWASEVEPFPIRVTTKRMPWVKHYGDIAQMDGGEIETVDIITFGSPCFPAGTLVLTDKGLTEIERIRVGDRVLTHKGRWRRVTATGAKVEPTIRLKGNHCGLVCTKNHPIYSYADGKFDWIPAEDMLNKLWGVPNTIECIPIPTKSYTSRKEKPMPDFSEGFFYFVGRWLGDGWVRDGQRTNRPVGQRYGTIYICDSFDKLAELKSTIQCVSNRYSIERNDSCTKVKCNSRLLCDWLTENFGKYAHAKEIPSWCFSMPKEYRNALLRGILDSDGYRKKHSWRVTTVSKKLVFGIRILAETLGYSTTVYSSKRPKTHIIEGREVNQRDIYIAEIFEKKPDISVGGADWYRVKSITEESPADVVYNLTVDEDNSYTADGIIVHNCQDMSVAGKRSGLDGSRSSLFYEAVRIIKEMRKATGNSYPRWAVWENVTGAFSSSGGEDFRCVLESLSRVKDDAVSIPMPKKWANAGEIVGDGYSIAWRTFDAQYWGVPQRRKRIYLVADFDGGSAGKILFESEGLSGYTPKGFLQGKETPGDSAEGAGAASCYGIDGYNASVSETEATLGINCGLSTGRNGLLVLNDQGGNRMDLTEEKTMTLRAESHHPPLVFENHSQDCRYRGPDDISQTVSSTFGMGGNNQPFVVETPKTMKIRCGKEGGGKGPLIQENKSATLSCNNDQTLFEPKAFGICSKDSNSMKSSNPDSGFYEATTTRCLDGNGGNPSCNQGGMAVVALEGNGSRPSHHGDGYSEEDVSYTLNATEHHAVAYGIDRAAFNQGQNALFGFQIENELEPTIVARGPGAVAHPTYCTSKNSHHTVAEKDLANTLVASDYKDPPMINDIPSYGFCQQRKAECVTFTEEKSGCLVNGTNPGWQNGVLEPDYIVRRLTPTECARLQGFPDWWCSDLGEEHPTDEEVYEWYKIFETHRKLTGSSTKPKTDKQIRDFLREPNSDSAEYKMWGNGVALPCVFFVLSGIAWAAECQKQ